MHRRAFIVAFVFLPLTTKAQGETSSRISIFTDLVNAIGAAGEAISKLTAGIKDLVIAGNDSYNYVAASRERDRLIDISIRTQILIAQQNVAVENALNEYLTKSEPNQKAWELVVDNILTTLYSVHLLLSDVQKENGAFVLEPAYPELNKTLAARSSLLEKLAKMPAPRTKKELDLLRQISNKYAVLINKAEEAVVQLNEYIKAKAK
ncbi:MAG: hypothetical protein AB1899_10245 [Pseudomonadota bacterium]